MTDVINLAFNSLNNDEFYDLFRHTLSETDSSSQSSPSASYENNIAQQFNLSAEELNYDSDLNQDLLPIPTSKYITQDQLNEVVKNFQMTLFPCYI